MKAHSSQYTFRSSQSDIRMLSAYPNIFLNHCVSELPELPELPNNSIAQPEGKLLWHMHVPVFLAFSQDLECERSLRQLVPDQGKSDISRSHIHAHTWYQYFCTPGVAGCIFQPSHWWVSFPLLGKTIRVLD